MLLVFLYHRAFDGKYGNSVRMLDNHFESLAKTYPIVLPRDRLQLFSTSICLTFDDAHLDFYTKVYPLLKKHRLKALLAVPANLIGMDTYCTWNMLKELVDSKIVYIASHSMNHANLLDPKVDVDYELIESKKILENRLKIEIDTFVYPYGKFNLAIQKKAEKHYQYTMRIGSSANLSWDRLLYRIPSDDLNHPLEKLTRIKKTLYLCNFIKNRLRNR